MVTAVYSLVQEFRTNRKFVKKEMRKLYHPKLEDISVDAFNMRFPYATISLQRRRNNTCQKVWQIGFVQSGT